VSVTPAVAFSSEPKLSDRAYAEVLTPSALDFVADLHRRFEARRQELLAARRRREAPSDFLPETGEVRSEDWSVLPPRADYADRRVEITGPTDRKMVINALNSGAKGFMADFEDANSPTWSNQVEGHLNLIDAIDASITYDSSDGRHYELVDDPATLLVRPRGWHLDERHLLVDGTPVAGALMDFGLYLFHNGHRLIDHGTAPYLYLPKLQHHLEARLWNDIFVTTQEALGLPHGTIRATILIETLPAAFQMDEMLYELRDHSYGLNAGRWDYIFSMIKTFADRPEFLLPDRTDVKMTVPFMRAYTELLVATCHRRGAFAMGGMAALIPSRRDPEANERAIQAVREDKAREAGDGFDGTWVAHPDVVEVALAAFDEVLGDRPNQIERQRPDVSVTPAQLLAAAATPGAVTEAGLRANLNVAFQYISFWLGGRGAAGINNLMEDAATAEISRSQVWQWIRHGATLTDGRVVTRELARQLLGEETARIRAEVGEETWHRGRPDDTRAVLERVVFADDFPEFLTLVAYERL
jgi:malate synthase